MTADDLGSSAEVGEELELELVVVVAVVVVAAVAVTAAAAAAAAAVAVAAVGGGGCPTIEFMACNIHRQIFQNMAKVYMSKSSI